MTRDELYAKLEAAQELLSDVYQFAQDNGLIDLERAVSMADTCIIEAYNEIECGETGAQYAEAEYDGQPSEAQEWHDFGADC
jgi:hypothetical protein